MSLYSGGGFLPLLWINIYSNTSKVPALGSNELLPSRDIHRIPPAQHCFMFIHPIRLLQARSDGQLCQCEQFLWSPPVVRSYLLQPAYLLPGRILRSRQEYIRAASDQCDLRRSESDVSCLEGRRLTHQVWLS